MKDGKKYGINDWPEDERPRERLAKFGAASLSDTQLLAIALRTGHNAIGMSAIDLARDLLEKFEGLCSLEQVTIGEFCDIDGMGPAKAAQIKAAFELGRRVVAGGGCLKGKIRGSKDVAGYYIPTLKSARKESFRVLLLSVKNRITREIIISEGSLTASIVHPREVFNPAVRDSAASIILVHNHPSGDPAPSSEDIDITKRLLTCGEMLGIKILDHVIIGGSAYYSFLDEGRLG